MKESPGSPRRTRGAPSAARARAHGRQARVCVLGAASVDLVARTPTLPLLGETVLGGPFAMFAGGKGASQAVAAARLGAQASFIGAVGQDGYGASLRQALEAEQVDLAHLEALPGIPTGVGLITVVPDGGSTIVVAPGANARLDRAAVERAAPALSRATVLLLQLEVPLESSLRAAEIARAAGALVIVNAAPARQRELDATALLRCCDVLVANRMEAAALTTVAARSQPPPAPFAECDALVPPALATQLARLLAGGARAAVITLAEQGAAWACGGRAGFVKPFRVESVDAAGAGDAFCGALALGLAESGRGAAARAGNLGAQLGEQLGKAVRFAWAAGASATTRPGAIPSLPTRAEVEGLLQADGETN